MRPIRAFVIFVALALIVSACGSDNSGKSKAQGSSGSSGSSLTSLSGVLADIKDLQGSARTDRLVELMKQEGGQLSVYTSLNADAVDALEHGFEALYHVDVTMYRANSETILPRLAEESKAGFHGADVVAVNGLAMSNLKADGMLDPYHSPAEADLVSGSVADGWTADSFSTFVVARNTSLVADNERPTSWEDLANPRWKGKLAIEGGDVTWYQTLHTYFTDDLGKSEAEADQIFEAIAGNAVIVKGHTLMAQLMAAGEYDLGVNYSGSIDRLKAQGAPLSWDPPVEPLIPEPQGVAPVVGAQHPAAAILFIDYLLGKDGQQVLVDRSNESARRDLAVATQAKRKVVDTDALLKDEQQWNDRFDQLLRLGTPAPSSG